MSKFTFQRLGPRRAFILSFKVCGIWIVIARSGLPNNNNHLSSYTYFSTTLTHITLPVKEA